MRLGSETVVFQNYAGTDQWSGKPVPDGPPIEVSGCNVQALAPIVPTEVTSEFKDIVTDNIQVWMPYAPIRATSTAEHDGKLYQVSGEPQVWRNMSGRFEHMLVKLEYVR